MARPNGLKGGGMEAVPAMASLLLMEALRRQEAGISIFYPPNFQSQFLVPARSIPICWTPAELEIYPKWRELKTTFWTTASFPRNSRKFSVSKMWQTTAEKKDSRFVTTFRFLWTWPGLPVPSFGFAARSLQA
jgi:hypothetical protein